MQRIRLIRSRVSREETGKKLEERVEARPQDGRNDARYRSEGEEMQQMAAAGVTERREAETRMRETVSGVSGVDQMELASVSRCRHYAAPALAGPGTGRSLDGRGFPGAWKGPANRAPETQASMRRAWMSFSPNLPSPSRQMLCVETISKSWCDPNCHRNES
jgi:hypothetical protein